MNRSSWSQITNTSPSSRRRLLTPAPDDERVLVDGDALVVEDQDQPPGLRDRRGEPGLRDRLRLTKATQLVNQVFPGGARFTSTIDAGAGNTNAYANPYDQQFQAHVSPEFSRLGLPFLVGVLGHERKHDTETQWAHHEARLGPMFRARQMAHHEARLGPMFRARQMANAGGLLEATVATLQEANLRRFEERRADRASGKTLARVRQLTGDPAMTPGELLDQLKPAKGTPTAWTPVSQYDTLGQRRHAVGKAFGRELRRLQSNPAPEGTAP